jgi:hypothetical protein
LDGYNRHGLLHIQRVADLYGHFIDKAKGLAEAGLERQARVQLQVLSNHRKRLLLDFTDETKKSDDAGDAQNKEAMDGGTTEAVDRSNSPVAPSSLTAGMATSSSSEMSAQEIAEWEAFMMAADTGNSMDTATATTTPNMEEKEADYDDPDEYEDNDYDDYDEDRDIENSLGLGTY